MKNKACLNIDGILVVLFLYCSTCGYSQTEAHIDTLRNGNVLVEVNGITAIVLNWNAIRWQGVLVSSWNPTVEELVICENLVMKYVANNEKESRARSGYGHPIIYENFQDYYWQFYCYYDERGRKIVRIGCVWKEEVDKYDLKWKEKLVAVCGGGSYYWGIKVNMRRKKCFDFFIN